MAERLDKLEALLQSLIESGQRVPGLATAGIAGAHLKQSQVSSDSLLLTLSHCAQAPSRRRAPPLVL